MSMVKTLWVFNMNVDLVSINLNFLCFSNNMREDECRMRSFVCLIIVIFYGYGLVLPNPVQFIGPSIKIHMSHTHEVESDHYHNQEMESDDDHDVDHHHASDKSDEHSSNTPHSHDIYVSLGSYNFQPAPLLTLTSLPKTELQYPLEMSESSPKEPIMGSIFRPPIFI
jgi:hypothetical protein